MTKPVQLVDAHFENSFVDNLPGEPFSELLPRLVPHYCFSRVEPTPVTSPKILAWSTPLSDFLGILPPLSNNGDEAEILSGNRVLSTMRPFSARYGGHQFGYWAGQLGDGRAISLGELRAKDGSWWELQLKGAGPTPYSRRGDGRAVLRSSLREFLCSEAMHHLGVPTTRALSLVETGNTVMRDMFYSGDARPEKGAIVTRVAPTFIRFGNFEILADGGEIDNLRFLANYVIRRFYPELGEPDEAAYIAWFNDVVHRTAELIAHWMSVGFVHGVMNTDNMSILGLTIDYGPYGWLEPYDPEWTPNTTDFREHRYAYGQQPSIGLWNLSMLGRALSALIPNSSAIEIALAEYAASFSKTYFELMARKLGFSGIVSEECQELISDLHEPLTRSQIDMTIFFRTLSNLVPGLSSQDEVSPELFDSIIEKSSYLTHHDDHSALRLWLIRYFKIVREKGADQRMMLKANPKYVLRNFLAQNAIEQAETGDTSLLLKLIHILEHPFDEHPSDEQFASKRPDWAKNKPGSATLSCSS